MEAENAVGSTKVFVTLKDQFKQLENILTNKDEQFKELSRQK